MFKYLLVLTILILPVAANGTTWYVPVDTPTIQGAIDLAAAGDTVLVAAGSYTGPGVLVHRF